MSTALRAGRRNPAAKQPDDRKGWAPAPKYPLLWNEYHGRALDKLPTEADKKEHAIGTEPVERDGYNPFMIRLLPRRAATAQSVPDWNVVAATKAAHFKSTFGDLGVESADDAAVVMVDGELNQDALEFIPGVPAKKQGSWKKEKMALDKASLISCIIERWLTAIKMQGNADREHRMSRRTGTQGAKAPQTSGPATASAGKKRARPNEPSEEAVGVALDAPKAKKAKHTQGKGQSSSSAGPTTGDSPRADKTNGKSKRKRGPAQDDEQEPTASQSKPRKRRNVEGEFHSYLPYSTEEDDWLEAHFRANPDMALAVRWNEYNRHWDGRAPANDPAHPRQKRNPKSLYTHCNRVARLKALMRPGT